MPEKNRNLLRDFLITRYADLRRRLEYRLGSEERADDALHDAWLRVDSMDTGGMEQVKHPASYLVRMAVNISIDQHRRDTRLLFESEVEELTQPVDTTADPERILSGQRDILELEEALEGLSSRRRSILLSVRVDGRSHRDIAKMFRISERMVAKELQAALQHCQRKLKRAASSEQV